MPAPVLDRGPNEDSRLIDSVHHDIAMDSTSRKWRMSAHWLRPLQEYSRSF